MVLSCTCTSSRTHVDVFELLSPPNLQEVRTAHGANSDANKATLKRHVVRAINNLASKDVKAVNDSASLGTRSCCQQSEEAASTFSRYMSSLQAFCPHLFDRLQADVLCPS